MNNYMKLIGIRAREVSKHKISTKIKNKVLYYYAELLNKEKNLLSVKI